MSKIVLQPAGSSDASEHYIDTIVNPVSIDRLTTFIDSDTTKRLKELHKNNSVPVWGVAPGKDGGNITKWDRVQPGDIVLFSRDNRIFASASVSFKLHNKELSIELWGTNAEGETWEYVYFLDEVRNQEISYKDFNRAADYKLNYVIQGFNVLDEEKSETIIKYFELESETYYPPVSKEEYFDAVTLDPAKALDKEGVVKGRTEQAFLRNSLFRGKKYMNCGICGHLYPVAFLVASHVKKRASCTDEEKRDFKNIVIPMCKFGCDELYEKGYLAVKNGTVILITNEDITEAVAAYLQRVKGKKCLYWTDTNSKYFMWHLKKFEGTPPQI